jgi:hypothetical protein
MAQFYLNIRDGDDVIRDPEAYQFPTAQAARDATVRIIRDMLRRNAAVDFDAGKQIEIADATGHAISIVRAYDALPEKMN